METSENITIPKFKMGDLVCTRQLGPPLCARIVGIIGPEVSILFTVEEYKRLFPIYYPNCYSKNMYYIYTEIPASAFTYDVYFEYAKDFLTEKEIRAKVSNKYNLILYPEDELEIL
jgi:hypothetical protein